MKKIIILLCFLPLFCLGQDYSIQGNRFKFYNDSTAKFQKLKVTDSLIITGEMIYEQPHACFADTTNQTTPIATKAYSVKFSTNIHIDDDIIHNVGDSVITVNETGMYYISWSGIFASSAPNKTVNIWICKNGMPVPISNTIFQLLGTAQERLATVMYIEEFTAGQTLRICWQSNDSGMTLKTTGKQTNPIRPTCPAIILTINKISD